jgi:acid phosphatase family membrane protein YuiD
MFTQEEIAVLRNSLNVIEIKGDNAQFLASLQIKLEKEYQKIEEEKIKLQKEKESSLPKEFVKNSPKKP